jgi:hypothetical protein
VGRGFFEKNSAGLKPLEIMHIYEEAYAARKATKKPGPWADYRLGITTAVAIVAILRP